MVSPALLFIPKGGLEMLNKLSVALLVLLFSGLVQSAPVAIGNLSFDDTAFADAINSISGAGTVLTFEVPGDGTFPINGITPEVALTDLDVNTGLFCNPAPCDVDLGFTNNVIVNGPGDDLLVFEQGGLESLNLTINGVQQNLPTADATTNATVTDADGTLLNLYYVDLTLFGLALGQTTNSVILNLIQAPFFGTSDPMAVVAVNSRVVPAVPVPAAVWLFGTALIGLVGFGKRRKVA
jgi:hypothetical protein